MFISDFLLRMFNTINTALCTIATVLIHLKFFRYYIECLNEQDIPYIPLIVHVPEATKLSRMKITSNNSDHTKKDGVSCILYI